MFLENVEKDGIKALNAWNRAVENGGLALRTKVGGTPYPRFWKDLWDALRLKEGDLFTIVVNYEGEECRIPTEARDMSGDHVLAPFRRGSFALLQCGEYVETYPGLRNPSLFMEVEVEEGKGATYVFAKDNVFERKYIEEHGGEGLQIIMYKKVGSSFGEHYIMRDVHLEGVKTPAIYFRSEGPGIYKIEFVRKLEVDDLCNFARKSEGVDLKFDDSSGKFKLVFFNMLLESLLSKYEEGIEVEKQTVGGYEIIFPLVETERGGAWALALLFSVNPGSGDLISKFNFAYDCKVEEGRIHATWRPVTDIQPLDAEGGSAFKITFELSDYDQIARIKWDEASGKFVQYEVKPGKILESIMEAFLSKDYFSEPVFKGDKTKGRMRVNIVDNVKEFKTWYEDARYNFDDHAKGVAGCEIVSRILLERHRHFFGIEGDIIIDKEGHNLGNNVFDIQVLEGKKVSWCSEWKTRFGEDVDIASELSRAKDGLLSTRIEAARNGGFVLPDHGYAFVVKITESYIEIGWEKVEIPRS